MYFLGIEHGTRGVRCAILPDASPVESFVPTPHFFFEINRKLDGVTGEFPSIVRIIKKHIPLSEVDLVVMTYSMGDAFTVITDIRSLKNRGIQDLKGAGRVVGLGSAIFEELKNSSLKVLAVPGINRHTPTLLPAFRILSSHCSAPDKVGSAYFSSLFLRSIGEQGENFILSDVGANTVSLLIKEGRIVGGVDAALGAPGLLQGPIDLEAIRSIDHGKLSANQTFSSSGLFPGKEYNVIKDEPNFEEKYQTLATSVAMEIYGLSALLPEPEGVVITGTGPYIEPNVFKKIIQKILDRFEVHYLNHQSAALGCACMARDIHKGRMEILGIKVPID